MRSLNLKKIKSDTNKMRYERFEDVINSLEKKKRRMTLLLGNGFSMAYDPTIFSYKALYDFLLETNDENLKLILASLKTKNFELMMSQLETFSDLLKAFDADPVLQQVVSKASAQLKTGLLNAINSLHPEHVFKVEDAKSATCAAFLTKFLNTEGQIFTTNYDLLLYWVLMRQNVPNAIDGFGHDVLNPDEVAKGEEAELSDLYWGNNRKRQNIFYLHGSLPLFDTGTEVVKEQYSGEGLLLENINARLDNGKYPIFVTAGNGDDKLAQIRHNSYLSDCYDKLSEVDGSIITFGFGFGEYDGHIIQALNRAAKRRVKVPPKLRSIYIGTYSPQDITYIESIETKFHAKIHTFDAKTVPLWEKI